MNKLFKLSLVITLICFGASAYGMNCKNETTDLIVQNSNNTSQIQAAQNQIPVVQWFPQEVIAQMAGHCWPKEKNILMRVCKSFEACLKNRQSILQENPATVGITDKIEALIKYAHDGDVNMTKFLLDHGVNVNFCNYLGIKPFHDAHQNVMPLLIKNGAGIHESKPQIHRLHEAAYAGDKKIVEILLASKVNPNIALTNDITPLLIASHKGHTEIVKLLLAADGIEVNKAVSGATPLNLASKFGHAEIVKLLLTAGAEVDKADKNGFTPLSLASQNGHTEIVKLLLTAEAAKNGATSLKLASQNGHTEIVKLLLAAGAEVDKADYQGWTPLCLVSYYSGNINVIQLLLTHGANIHATLTADSVVDPLIKKGDTALDIARKKGHNQVVELLEAALQHEKTEKQLQETTGSEKDTY